MICIRYSLGEGCEISGTPAELRAVAHKIENIQDFIFLNTDMTRQPAPYQIALSALLVRVGSGPVCVVVQEGILNITADANSMEPLTSYFLFEDSSPEGCHVHHEYFPGNVYIDPDSVALVVSVSA